MKRLYCRASYGTFYARREAMNISPQAPRPVADEWEWQFDGACRGMDPEMFFHPDGERGPRRRNRENAAKAVCSSCPVLQLCRDHALAIQEPYGIWGGLSEDDRAVLLGKEEPTIYEAS